jgi:hypothetical protein
VHRNAQKCTLYQSEVTPKDDTKTAIPCIDRLKSG